MQPNTLVMIPRVTLEAILDRMEAYWYQIDSEWGVGDGGLDTAIARGEADEIAELRRILKL